MAPPKNSIGAVRTTLAVLDLITERDDVGVTEVATELAVSKGTAHNHLSTLEHEGYVVKTGEDRYRLGFKFLDLAHHAERRVGILDLVSGEVDALAEQSGEMALYTVEEHGIGVCLYRALGENAVQTPLYVGHRSPLHHTAVGKAILAHLPPERVEEILDRRGLTPQTPETITDREELYAQLEEVREQGFAFNRGETIPGLVGVGAPIVDQDNEVNGAISIIGPDSRMDEDRFYGEIPDMITRSVNIIGINATTI